jgi:primosomal protein N' (replication factor Y)
MRRIVQVALPLPLFRTFSYAVPPDLQDRVFPGSTVEVDFHGRVLTGWVVKEGGEELPGLKEIRDVLPFPPFPPSLLGFSQRLSLLYLSPLGEVLASFFPPLGKSAKKYLGFRVFAGREHPGMLQEGLACCHPGG